VGVPGRIADGRRGARPDGATLRRVATAAGAPEKYSDALTAFWMYQLASARALKPDADCATILRTYPRLLDKSTALAY
jgi:hypothetical protein